MCLAEVANKIRLEHKCVAGPDHATQRVPLRRVEVCSVQPEQMKSLPYVGVGGIGLAFDVLRRKWILREGLLCGKWRHGCVCGIAAGDRHRTLAAQIEMDIGAGWSRCTFHQELTEGQQ